ncbi:MerR family transcriptional regulator [Sphingomonas sp. DBB INV C78]|uniref:MerR family transcriptional regulator n=1 Tax=Sphingomonas sp. DBB INV C78 TaxID=3349434 RepID=UPI0036D2FE4F
MATGLTIGHLAKAAETKVETVRYYERIGLLEAPGRTQGNYRAYGADALSRLSFIRRARDLGFSIDQVRDLLNLAGQKQRDCGSVDVMALEHLAEIDRKLADLTALRRELGALISSCQGGTISECRILEALAPRTER